MNYIQQNVYPEEEADLDDPIGYIKITGDEEIIIEDYTYIDSFFAAFADGIEQMKTEDVVRADPIVEPNDIIFRCNGNSLEIEYGNQKAIIFNKSQFVEEVKIAVAKLIEILDEFADSAKQKKRQLIKLRSFL